MIPCQRHLFDIPDHIAYLNCAYMSPLMRSAITAGEEGLARKSRPWEIRAEDFFNSSEEFRTVAARMFDATRNDIAIIPSASYGISTAALNLPISRGQNILMLDEQFPSNVYPWRRLAHEKQASIAMVPWPEDGDWTAAVLRELSDRIAIAALPNVPWTSGGVLDLARISEACRRNGTALALDLTQSLGALPFSVKQVQPDFAIAANYKWLLGPYSIGVMYVAPKWQQQGRPLEENWIQRENARDFSGLIQYVDGYEPGARRFDMGERSNFTLLPAARAAMEQILTWGIEEISAYCGALTKPLAEAAPAVGLTPWPEKFRAPHYLCLRTRTQVPADLMERLQKGHIFISVRGSSLRITPHVYNSKAEIEKLLYVMEETLR
ncbi:MAG TPA: aminotransferase class V-fold PLP-dependent enzyme [Terriglobales bacterium]|nr:aminotransferase class V-fold PLP-dependent enzyme [Terriglobales bacterium]